MEDRFDVYGPYTISNGTVGYSGDSFLPHPPNLTNDDDIAPDHNCVIKVA